MTNLMNAVKGQRQHQHQGRRQQQWQWIQGKERDNVDCKNFVQKSHQLCEKTIVEHF